MNEKLEYPLSELTGMCLDYFAYEGNYSIDYDETYYKLEKNFVRYYGADIKKALFSMGISVMGYNGVSSRYTGASDIYIYIKVTNKTKLKKTIISEKQHIQRALGNQRATWWGAENVVESELERLKKDAYTPDKEILGVLLRQKVDFGDADANTELLMESMVEEEEE